MKTLLVIISFLISISALSQTTKAKRYEMYKARCYDVDTVQIKISGYLKYDTLILRSIPVKPTYYGKVIVNSVKVSDTRAIIVVVDTVWNSSPIPTYAFGNSIANSTNIVYPADAVMVYKNKKIMMKLCRPVSYTLWTKNELYYDQLLTTIKTNLNLK